MNIKKILLVLVVCVCGLFTLTGCSKEEVLAGQYTETFGKNQDEYTTKVNVTVKDGKIVKVEIAEDSNHYTKGSSKWTEDKWTAYETEVLKSFEGKTLEQINKEITDATQILTTGATVTRDRIYKAVIAALTDEAK